MYEHYKVGEKKPSTITKDELDYRKRVYANVLILMPLHVLGLSGLGVFLWKAIIKWVTIYDQLIGLLWAGICFILIIIEFMIVRSFVNCIQWMVSGSPSWGWSAGKDMFYIPMLKKMPIKNRMKTILYAAPGILALDVGLLIMTITLVLVTMQSWMNGDVSKSLLSVCLIILMTADVLITFFQVSLIHWAMTGYPIKKLDDMKNWQKNP